MCFSQGIKSEYMLCIQHRLGHEGSASSPLESIGSHKRARNADEMESILEKGVMNVHLKYTASLWFSSILLSVFLSVSLSLRGELFFPVVIFILSQLFPAQVVMETNPRRWRRNQIWSPCITKDAPGRRPRCPVSFTHTKGAEISIGS